MIEKPLWEQKGKKRKEKENRANFSVNFEGEKNNNKKLLAMEGLQRSAVSFRRQGSSGLVWDDRFLSGELKQTATASEKESEENQEAKSTAVEPISITIERSRSNGGRGYRTGKVSPAIEPPSPKVSACGFCSAFGKPAKKSRRTKNGKRRSR